jgi:antitoxin CptB
MDLVLGRFVDACINDLDDGELDDLEALMEVPDPDLFAWLTGQEPVAASYDTSVLRAVAAFHAARRG